MDKEMVEAIKQWENDSPVPLSVVEREDLAQRLQASWTARQTETIRHAYNAGVAWAIGNGMDIDEYLEAQK